MLASLPDDESDDESESGTHAASLRVHTVRAACLRLAFLLKASFRSLSSTTKISLGPSMEYCWTWAFPLPPISRKRFIDAIEKRSNRSSAIEIALRSLSRRKMLRPGNIAVLSEALEPRMDAASVGADDKHRQQLPGRLIISGGRAKRWDAFCVNIAKGLLWLFTVRRRRSRCPTRGVNRLRHLFGTK